MDRCRRFLVWPLVFFSHMDHPHIPAHEFESLLKHFASIDTVLSLHFAHSTTPALASTVVERATALSKRRVTMAVVHAILHVSPGSYCLAKGRDGLTITVGESQVGDFGRHLGPRRDQFQKDIASWIEAHPELHAIPSAPTPAAASPCKVVKPASAKGFQDLRNNQSKFKFKEKPVVPPNSKLSLLERIKLKEKLNKEKFTETPEQKHQRYILGKRPAVFEIVYEMCGSAPRTVPLPKLVMQIQDSFTYPMGEDEVVEVIQAIAALVPKIEVVTRGLTTVVRVRDLERADLLKLQK